MACWPRTGSGGVRLLLATRVERAMDAELRHHVECEIGERVRRGCRPTRRALPRCATSAASKRSRKRARDARGAAPLEDLVADLGYAARVLRRNPAITTAAVLTFALGIGAATAIFSLVYGVLLRPLPYAAARAPGRRLGARRRDGPSNVVSPDNFEAWRDAQRGIRDRSPPSCRRSVTLSAGAAPERLIGAEVSPGYFRRSRRRAGARARFDGRRATRRLGRSILSDALWKRRFGGDPSSSGRRCPCRAYTVVGVMPAGFEPPQLSWLGHRTLWFPFVVDAADRRWGRSSSSWPARRLACRVEQADSACRRRPARRKSPATPDGPCLVPLAEQITGRGAAVAARAPRPRRRCCCRSRARTSPR